MVFMLPMVAFRPNGADLTAGKLVSAIARKIGGCQQKPTEEDATRRGGVRKERQRQNKQNLVKNTNI
jgi:hypothetical protein